MSILSDSDLTAIERNHARLAAIPTQHETLDMFAVGEQVETLTMRGETLTERPARAVFADRQLSILL